MTRHYGRSRAAAAAKQAAARAMITRLRRRQGARCRIYVRCAGGRLSHILFYSRTCYCIVLFIFTSLKTIMFYFIMTLTVNAFIFIASHAIIVTPKYCHYDFDCRFYYRYLFIVICD